MARLIDASELIEHMFLGTEYDSTVDDGMDKTEAMCKAFKCGWNDALASVMDYAPTVDAVPLEDYRSMEQTVNKLTKAIADAVPVKHGHWVEVQRIHETDHTAICECSLCGDTVWVYDGQRAWNYCPNCGAKMDEVEEDG